MRRLDNTGEERAESVLRHVEQANRRSRWDSTVRGLQGKGDSKVRAEVATIIPTELLSDRLEELENAVNRLEWTDRRLRAELKRAEQNFQIAQRARVYWRVVALVVMAWLVGSVAGLDGLGNVPRLVMGDSTIHAAEKGLAKQ